MDEREENIGYGKEPTTPKPSAEELGKQLINEELDTQLIESRLRTETFKIVVKGFGIAFVVFVVLVLVARLFGWVER